MKRIYVFVGLMVLMVGMSLVIGSTEAAQSHSKLAPDLADLVARGRGKRRSNLQAVIVQTSDSPAGNVKYARLRGGKVKRIYRHLKAYAAEMPLSEIAALSRNRNVKWISLDRAVQSSMAWAIPATRTNVGWTNYGVSGAGIGVAILDSGTVRHDDLSTSRLAGWKDCTGSRSDFMDDNGHGTHVAGIAVGDGNASVNGNYSLKFYGVARGARIIGVKVLDSTGRGLVSNVIAGIDWCITNKAAYNIRVINLSLGHQVGENYTTDPLCQACERAWKAGIVVVCAAGNQGRLNPNNSDSNPAYMTIDSPGNDPYVITVGATNTRNTLSTADDVMASYSGHGPSRLDFILKPDLVAPGNRAVSLRAESAYMDTNYSGNKVSPSSYGGSGLTRYFVLSGTSMASPMVAGAAALMLEKDPTLTPDTVKARLMASANEYVYIRNGTPASIFIRGAGQLDVAAALAHTGTITTGYAWSPKVIRGNDSGLFYLSTQPFGGGSNAIWGGLASWGDNAIWGDNALWADNALYGDNAIWGDNALWADNAIWGDNAIWADSNVSPDGLLIEGED